MSKSAHKKRIYLSAIVILHLFSISLLAQEGEQILPVGLNQNIYNHIPTVELPSIDSARMRANQSRPTKEQYIAYNFKTNFSPQFPDLKANPMAKNYRTWLMKLQTTGAYGIALVFSDVKLLPGEKLFIYNLSGMYGGFDQHNIPKSGVLPLDFLRGDEVVVEFDVPIEASETGGFVIETVSHAYRDIFSLSAQPPTVPGQSQRLNALKSDCYVCLEGDTIQQNKRAVVKMTIHLSEGSKVCTGTLVNNTAQDKKPYVITAQHCIANQEEAQRTVFTFNFEDLSCNGSLNTNTPSLNGSAYLASGYENDFAIVMLNDYPSLSIHPYYAGWDISDQVKDHSICIHHPQGGPKKISVFQGTLTAEDFDDNTPRAHNAYWRISKWDEGATEGGSSGSPLFNKNHLVVGTLTGGSSECGSPFNDYFQRLSQSWQPFTETDRQLKNWLDPLSSGLKSQKGMDPFEGIKSVCDTLSNIQADESPELIPYTSGVGYYSGYNSDNIASYAEKFYSPDSVMLTASLFNVGSINQNSTGGILVAVHQNNQGLPGSVIFETYVPYNRMNSDEPNYVGFYPFLQLKGTFFISYTLSYSALDSFAVRQSPWRDQFENTAFVKLAQGWVPIKTISPALSGASLNIGALICKNYTQTPPPEADSGFSLYPNPSSSVIILKLDQLLSGKFELEIFDLQGRMYPVRYYQYDKNFLIDTASLASGLYIMGIQANGKKHHVKFFKS